ncbi:hypothetical protein [Streptomyces neyagawaensis]|uniref:hypothetical protein n=1 Tax=Streptomyces neyagawaensis TaxID=42238 RepID=UPI00197E3B1B|nr:hypothetical protein [Streptomyces neyagawaensis]MCL6737234.1 hypothetical protein [Streptomyces neyagawaensis]MDE1687456.1 hypothetical protein [Streptomyces neyagawaensis]
MLGPRPDGGDDARTMAHTAAQSGDDEPGSDDGQAAEGGELPERLTPQAAGRIWASSMGLSFVVPASIGTLSVTARWGRHLLADRIVDTSPNPVRV